MSAISATSVKVGTLVDGTLRITCDVEPGEARAAFALFGSPGQPMALAALKPASSKPEKPEAQPTGTLCTWAAMRCSEPAFIAWIAEAYTKIWDARYREDAEEQAAEVVRHLCGVASRRELDTNEGAAALLHKHIRLPYAAWLKKAGR